MRNKVVNIIAREPSGDNLQAKLAMARENMDTQTMALDRLKAELEASDSLAGERPAKYQSLATSYDRQYTAVCRARDALDRLTTLDEDDGYWADRTRELTEQLLDSYADRGPQYEVLVKRLVFAEVAVEQLEKSGRHYDTSEGRNANKSVLDAVQALQKYTESQKSEMIQTAQQRAMLVIMEIAERVIAPKYPEAWARVVEEIERQLPAGGDNE